MISARGRAAALAGRRDPGGGAGASDRPRRGRGVAAGAQRSQKQLLSVWRQVAAPPRLRRGYSVEAGETEDFGAAAVLRVAQQVVREARLAKQPGTVARLADVAQEVVPQQARVARLTAVAARPARRRRDEPVVGAPAPLPPLRRRDLRAAPAERVARVPPARVHDQRRVRDVAVPSSPAAPREHERQPGLQRPLGMREVEPAGVGRARRDEDRLR